MSDIKIYGKLVNSTTNNELAGADQVKDNTQGKFQNEINTETKTKLDEIKTNLNKVKSDLSNPTSGLTKKVADLTTKVDNHATNKDNPHEVTKTQVGLGNVTNDAQVKRSEMGQPLGVATLDKFGKVPESQLPSYVDDVLEFEDKSALPDVGESGKIYVTLDNNLTYRWTGSTYIKIGGSGGIVNVESIPDDYINALDESLQNNHK